MRVRGQAFRKLLWELNSESYALVPMTSVLWLGAFLCLLCNFVLASIARPFGMFTRLKSMTY